MRSAEKFDPYGYWSGLVVGGDTAAVDEVGHPDMGRAFNLAAYRLRLNALVRALRALSTSGGSSEKTRVFEGGYGVGYYLRFWNKLGYRHVSGVDLSPQACENARRLFPDFDLRASNLAQIDQWPDWPKLVSQFDIVTAIDVIYHILDEQAAASAVRNLSQLVAPGGALLITEKFPVERESVRETRHVVRRSIDWYSRELEPSGLVLAGRIPVFWCMDPPVFYGKHRLSARLARLAWIAMRASVKFWPRNSRIQNTLGSLAGAFGATVDRMVLARAGETPNLTLAVFRREPMDAPQE